MMHIAGLGHSMRQWPNRLGVRLASVLGVILLPLLAALVYQTNSNIEWANTRNEAALMGETLHAVAGTTLAVQSARTQAQLLAKSLPALGGDVAECIALMQRAKSGLDAASLVAFVPLDGNISCSSDGRTYDFSASPQLTQAIIEPRDAFLVTGAGPVTGRAVLQVVNAVNDAVGNRIGFISISLPHNVLGDMARERLKSARSERPIGIMLFGQDGVPLAPVDMQDAMLQRLPEDIDLAGFVDKPVRTFSAVSRQGEQRAYSVVDLIPGDLYVIGTWPATALTGTGLSGRVLPVLIPVLMWAVSVLVVYFAFQRMVIRHLRRLSRALSLFASGKRIVITPDFRNAPQEIRDLSDTYLGMTETILHDEAELEDMLRQKEILLREVHHRVKNNLQMISSIISMQSRKANTIEAKTMLKGLQTRVLSLATVHRELYPVRGLVEISAGGIVADIVRQLVRATTGKEQDDRIDVTIDDIGLTPDQAVPVSLLLTEALTNALKYARSADGPGKISVSLRRFGSNTARLEVRNSCIPGEDRTPREDGGLGMPLITAFIQQLGAHAEFGESGGEYVVAVEFEIEQFEAD